MIKIGSQIDIEYNLNTQTNNMYNMLSAIDFYSISDINFSAHCQLITSLLIFYRRC